MLREKEITVTIPNGGTTEVQEYISGLFGGKGITVELVYETNNTTNNITFTFYLYDSHGNKLYTKASIAENTFTADKQDYPIMDGGRIGVLPSGDPGASTGILTAHIFYNDGR